MYGEEVVEEPLNSQGFAAIMMKLVESSQVFVVAVVGMLVYQHFQLRYLDS